MANLAVGQNSQPQQPSKFRRIVNAEKEQWGYTLDNAKADAIIGAETGLGIGAGVGALVGCGSGDTSTAVAMTGVGAVVLGIPLGSILGVAGGAVGGGYNLGKVAYNA